MRKGLLLVFAVLMSARPTYALDADTRDVLIIGGYGVAAGTALGLISWPIAQTPKSIYIGAALGALLGVAAGVYHIHNRESPQNPLSPHSAQLEEQWRAGFRTEGLYFPLQVAEF